MRQAESMRSRVKCGNFARRQRCLRMVTESAHRRAAKASGMREAQQNHIADNIAAKQKAQQKLERILQRWGVKGLPASAHASTAKAGVAMPSMADAAVAMAMHGAPKSTALEVGRRALGALEGAREGEGRLTARGVR